LACRGDNRSTSRKQRLGVTGRQRTGDPTLIQLGDQPVIHHRQPPPLRLQPAHQLE